MKFSMRFPLLFLTVTVLLGGCNSAMQTYKKGVKHFEAGEYNPAIDQFAKTGDKVDAARLNYYTAEAYRLSDRIQLAAPYYKKALDANVEASVPGATPDLAPKPAFTDVNLADVRLNYAYALKATGDYAGAQAQLQQFLDSRPKNKVSLARAQREIETLRAIGAIQAKQTDFRLKNLGGVNSAGTEYAPVLRGDELIFTASRKDVTYKANGLPMTALYKAKIGQNPDETGADRGDGAGPQLFSNSVFQNDVNEGTPAFSKDGKAMVFARGNNGKRKGGDDVDLYLSRQDKDGNWSAPFRLPISDSLAWDGSPAFSADGKTLYFASNRTGTVGGLDLYRANMDASGRFSRPVNMGRDINTAGNELFPFVAADGKLYFSSDGHPGLGKLDVFVATRSGGVIRVENMGQPINSPADDFGLTFPEANKGYMASNRAGGKGDDDIYLVESGQPDTTTIAKNTPPKQGAAKVVRYFLAGTVATNTSPNNPLDSARVRIVDDANDATVAEVTTGKPGTFGKFPVQEGKSYSILAERPGYLTRREPFTMQGRSIPDIFLTKPETDTTFNVALLLDKVELNKTFVLENIYYDLDKYNIRSDAATELDKLVTILKDNPTLKIELSSHTDVRAADAYNLRLSQNRAKAAVDYIISKGIDAERLTAKGYGETQLVVKNARTEEEHQRNRRTEFKVLAL
ncbi:PD40 domain-containing protein [Fibrella sp. HMF5335]|uniref:PD40 domain-containing protein n=1 Tax=Fibrella rubiginis TaxID=2817060 RepID=A0A939K5U9_9BACT|nr:OmpA family protein [Fibrella rubiginis]MBO0938153.1 PD40 domain-containing protein [Fibrella rubiginis]